MTNLQLLMAGFHPPIAGRFYPPGDNHAEVITITGKSYRLRNKAAKAAGAESKNGGTGNKDLKVDKDGKQGKDAPNGNQTAPCKKRAS